MSLAAESLAYGWPGRTIGRGLSFAIEPGEVVALLGPNGTGKTTLIRTLLGLLAPHAGRVTIEGRDLARLSRAEAARRLAYVPQAVPSPFPFTVAEVVLMGRAAHLGPFSRPGRRDRAAAEAAIARVGIAHLADRPFTAVSGGERQLTLIARALAQGGRVMVLDEPTASLDFGNQVRVLELIASLARDGAGVLFTTHDPDHAFLVADRVLLLKDGTLLAAGTPRETITEETLYALYGVGVRIVEVADGAGRRLVCLPRAAA
ncbi:ABC transporter ATP-binding protein [Elioraea thermophila]|uniref:ABC transporter ATP-binding protein n=1 Tax=Elioraea thermophila TaxID=2185104 RepID=UPI000DF275B7|nr:ABC transporter ATP-binding protein [Elioraea thermophila]